MTLAKVRSRFAARISSANRVEPRMQTISGRPGTAQSFGRAETDDVHVVIRARRPSRLFAQRDGHHAAARCPAAGTE